MLPNFNHQYKSFQRTTRGNGRKWPDGNSSLSATVSGLAHEPSRRLFLDYALQFGNSIRVRISRGTEPALFTRTSSARLEFFSRAPRGPELCGRFSRLYGSMVLNGHVEVVQDVVVLVLYGSFYVLLSLYTRVLSTISDCRHEGGKVKSRRHEV